MVLQILFIYLIFCKTNFIERSTRLRSKLRLIRIKQNKQGSTWLQNREKFCTILREVCGVGNNLPLNLCKLHVTST